MEKFDPIPRIVMLAILLMLAASARSAPQEQRFEIAAKRFEFSPSEITVKRGVPVVLVLRSEDVTHGIGIKEYAVKQDIHKKGSTIVRFTPTAAGDIVAMCSHFCGSAHGHMRLVIHVTE